MVMATSTLATGITTGRTGRVNFCTQMAPFTKVSGWTISIMALVRSSGLTKRYLKGNIVMVRNMEKVVSLGPTEVFSRAISSITRWRDTEFMSGSMDGATMASGRTTSSMGTAFSHGRMAECTRGITLRTSARAKVSSLGKCGFVISNAFLRFNLVALRLMDFSEKPDCLCLECLISNLFDIYF